VYKSAQASGDGQGAAAADGTDGGAGGAEAGATSGKASTDDGVEDVDYEVVDDDK